MRVLPLILMSLCVTTTVGLSSARADDYDWHRRHEWREHHWLGEYRERHRWDEPRQVYVEPPAYYPPPQVYYEPAPSIFGFGIGVGHEEDDEE